MARDNSKRPEPSKAKSSSSSRAPQTTKKATRETTKKKATKKTTTKKVVGGSSESRRGARAGDSTDSSVENGRVKVVKDAEVRFDVSEVADAIYEELVECVRKPEELAALRPSVVRDPRGIALHLGNLEKLQREASPRWIIADVMANAMQWLVASGRITMVSEGRIIYVVPMFSSVPKRKRASQRQGSTLNVPYFLFFLLLPDNLFDDIQTKIVEALLGKALKKKELARALSGIREATLYEKDRMKRLLESDIVRNHPVYGYWTRLAPPPELQ